MKIIVLLLCALKYFSTILIILLFALNLKAQPPGGKKFADKKPEFNMFGQVLDNNNEGLPYVSVALFRLKDSSYVKGTATELNGKFALNVSPGNYYVKISFLSFQTKTINNIQIVRRI